MLSNLLCSTEMIALERRYHHAPSDVPRLGDCVDFQKECFYG